MANRDNFSEQLVDQELGYSENLIPNMLKNSWWTAGTSGWEVNSGNVEVEEDEAV